MGREVKVEPRGQPERNGVLKGVASGKAEVEQSLHVGKFAAYVPLVQIEQLQALVQRRIEPQV